MMKLIAVLTCLLIASCALMGQDKTVAVRDADDPNAPSRLFEWNSRGTGEFDLWLNENKRLLGRCDVCDLNVSWKNEEARAYSSVHNIAVFLIGPADEQVSRVIRHIESGVDVRVGVQYFPAKPGISQIRIALAFEGLPDDIFYEITRSQAETLRDKEWKFVTAMKEMRVKNLRYTFSLTCTNSKYSSLNSLIRPK